MRKTIYTFLAILLAQNPLAMQANASCPIKAGVYKAWSQFYNSNVGVTANDWVYITIKKSSQYPEQGRSALWNPIDVGLFSGLINMKNVPMLEQTADRWKYIIYSSYSIVAEITSDKPTCKISGGFYYSDTSGDFITIGSGTFTYLHP